MRTVISQTMKFMKLMNYYQERKAKAVDFDDEESAIKNIEYIAGKAGLDIATFVAAERRDLEARRKTAAMEEAILAS